jgi:predicted ATPase
MTSDRSIEPLLGRAAELSRLGALLDEALSGRPRVVIVSGEPGIGKTTLLRQFADDAARRGARILWPRSFGSPGAPPYWLWRSALGPPDLLREVTSERRTLIERSADRLQRLGTDDGVVLVLDDADQADDPSIRALLDVVRFLRAGRLLVCVASDESGRAQDDWRSLQARLSREPVTDELALRGLAPDDARRALEVAVHAEIPEPVAANAFAVTGGNPLHVGELGRWLRTRPPDAWSIPPPGTLDELIDARLQDLPARARDVLNAGSILGERFRIVEVARILDLDPQE